MHALIVGCGYLGRRVADLWQAGGATISAVTRSPQTAETFAARGWHAVIADICQPASLASLPAADVVLYAVAYDRTSPFSREEVVVTGLRRVATRLAETCGKLVFISSSSVYGQESGEWVDEDSPCEPQQPGGQACLAAERALREVTEASPMAVNVLRLSGIYGPQRLLSRVEDLRAGTALPGRPDAWLNLIHVDDAAAAVVACADHGTRGATYLVSDDEPVLRGDYYQTLSELAGAPPPAFDTNQPARHGSAGVNKRCRNTRMRKELGVKLQFATYREGLPAALAETKPH